MKTAAPPGDDDNFWDFKEEPKKDEKKLEKKAEAKDGPKGSGKTLNKAQASQFSKWCQV